jgi:hypothetical protein
MTAAVSTTTASTTSAAAFTLGASFVNYQRAPQKIFAIEGCDCFFGFRIITNFREAESARLTRETIPQKSEGIRLNTNFGKQRRHLFFRSLERQISDIQFLHGRLLLLWRLPECECEAEETGSRLGRLAMVQPLPAEASAPAAHEHLAASDSGSQQPATRRRLLWCSAPSAEESGRIRQNL